MTKYGEIWLVFLCVWLLLASLGDQAVAPGLRVTLIVGSFLAATVLTLRETMHHHR